MKCPECGGREEKVKEFADKCARLKAEIDKPEHCPTCDGYGYLRWNGEYAGWSKVDQISSDALHKDIPCPDCNV